MSEFDETFGKAPHKYPTMEELAKMVITELEAGGFNHDIMNRFNRYVSDEIKKEELPGYRFYWESSGQEPAKKILDEISKAKEDNSYEGEAFLNMSALLFNSLSSSTYADEPHVLGLLNALNKKPFEDKKLEYDVLDNIQMSALPDNIGKAILIQKIKNPYAQRKDFDKLIDYMDNKEELLGLWRLSNEHFDKLIGDESKKEYPNFDKLKSLYSDANGIQREVLNPSGNRYGKLIEWKVTEEFKKLYEEFRDKYDLTTIQMEQISTHLEDLQKQDREENVTLKNENSKLQTELDAEKKAHKKFEDNYNFEKRNKNELDNTYRKLKNDYEELQKKLNALQTQFNNMKIERDLYKASSEDLTATVGNIDNYVNNSKVVWAKDIKKILANKESQNM